MAFGLLGVVALATLTAALLHGPALAGLGVIGAFVAPLLVASEAPNYWALAVYLGVVTAASYALARARLWRWLAIAATAFTLAWLLPGIGDPAALAPHIFHLIAGFALVAVFIVAGLLWGPEAEPGGVDAVSSGALFAYVVAAALLVVAHHHDGATLAAYAALVAATVAMAWRTDAAAAAVPGAALIAAALLAEWAVNIPLERLLAPGPLTGIEPGLPSGNVGAHLGYGAALAVLFLATGFLAQGRSVRAIAPILWASAAVLAPLAILIALYYRLSGFQASIPFAGLARLLAAVFGAATEVLWRRAPAPGQAAASAIFAVGAIAALALTLTFALERGWLTVSLALMTPAVAWVAEKRPVPGLRAVAAVLALLVLARVGWNPRIVGDDLGTTPILNWLLYGYGVPAAAFWVAGTLLRRRADDTPARIADALAILFTVLLAGLEIRHAVNHGDVFRHTAELAETGLQVSVWLALAIGLERLRLRTRSPVHNAGAILMGALAAGGIVLGLWLFDNPLFTGEEIDGRFLNLLLVGYLLPAVLAVTLALVARPTRPIAYRAVAAAFAVALSLCYLTLEVRRLFQGPMLNRWVTTDAELYAYSAVWLAFGIVLLLAGFLLRSQPARLASAAVILITVAKVFLYDLAGLAGVYRALSFIGLGLVLVGIGWLYQRLLFPPRQSPISAPASA